jgi:ATP-dependent Clp protease ATP-binding subunit ClpC
MANGLCDIDKQRPATHTVRVNRNGRATTLELCSVHYNQLRAQQAQTSPFESLFSGSGLGEFFGDDFPSLASQLGTPLPREREATNIEEFISENTKEIIQQAAETAVKFGVVKWIRNTYFIR